VNLAAGRLTLPIDDGTEGVPLGGSIGITGRVPGYFTDLEIEDVAFFADPPGDVAGPPCARSAVPALLASAVTIRGVADWGMHVRHISRSAPDPVQIDTLQWAGSAQALAASNLIWGDPELESLQWQDLVPRGGRRLDGGVDLLCDLPDSALAAYPVWLVRIVSSGPTSSQRGISQLVPNARITPAHKLTWGEIKADYR
jgi:hypothetical protein